MTIQECAQRLQGLDRVLILTHVRPDGDTIGSAGALCQALRDMGKEAYLLPNPELTATFAPYAAPYLAPEGYVPACVVSTDVAALQLLPENARPYQNSICLAIDHHPSNEGFGAENCVVAEAAACGEILYDIIREMTPVTQQIAMLLYVAIATDTGCFVYSNTTGRTHAIAAKRREIFRCYCCYRWNQFLYCKCIFSLVPRRWATCKEWSFCKYIWC